MAENVAVEVGLSEVALEAYSRELHLQAEIAMMHLLDMDEFAKQGALDDVRLWATIDAVLSAMARIADILWPTQKRGKNSGLTSSQRGKILREHYRIKTVPWLAIATRGARNALQHFAERLDQMPADEANYAAMRTYDSSTSVVTVCGESMNLRVAVLELSQLAVLVPDPDEIQVPFPDDDPAAGINDDEKAPAAGGAS